jgi:DNA-binding NarL/FixJ family response regulator
MHGAGRARILIADDHVLVAEALKHLLEPEFHVVGTVSDGRKLMESLAEIRPDVVILDIAMPELNGLDAGEQIKRLNRGIKVIYLTVALGADVAAEAFRRGASGYVVKQANSDEIRIAVRQALRGRSFLSTLVNKDEVQLRLKSGAEYKAEKNLSDRQREVLRLLAEGKRIQEIAKILSLQYGTIAFHKYRIMEQLGIKTNAGLIEYATRRGIAGNQS